MIAMLFVKTPYSCSIMHWGYLMAVVERLES